MQHFAVIGNPISHSKSPLIHQLFSAQTGIALSYTTIEVQSEDLAKTILNFPGQGLNVTMPFKQQAFYLMDECSSRALSAQAINTIKYLPDGSRYGDNTDGVGLINDLTLNKQITLTNKHILLLGAGGAARGLIVPLLNEQPARLIIANRTFEKAIELAGRYNDTVIACPLAELKNFSADLVINAANVTTMPDITLNSGSSCYDLAYGRNTPFLQWAAQHATQSWDGLGMLIEQAAAAFYVWHGIYPLINIIRQALEATYVNSTT
jgi:shikimate dehydrogenase